MDIKTLELLVQENPDLLEKINKNLEIPKFYFALRDDLKEDKKFLPTRGTSRATGWDVRAAMNDKKSLSLRPGQKALIPLGIRGFCPEGWWYQLMPRSSSFAKKSLHCLYGVIDCDFEGQLFLASQYLPDVNCLGKDLVIEYGDALGQIIPKKLHEIELIETSNKELDEMYTARNADRGTGGFGSTSK